MTVEQRDKYAYELMVKNNPEEAAKQLLLKDKENERLSKNQRYYKNGVFSLEYDKETMSDMIDDYKSRIDKTIEYIKKNTRTAPFENYKYLEIDDEEIEELLKLLKGEDIVIHTSSLSLLDIWIIKHGLTPKRLRYFSLISTNFLIAVSGFCPGLRPGGT